VKTSATYVLKAGSEVELLETTDVTGSTAMDLVGNEFGNAIIGNNGGNTIVGYGGLDVMTGNGGGDVFVWTSTAETGVAGNEADVITDFNRLAGDLIAFNPIDADGNAGNGDTAFEFIPGDGSSFTGVAQITYFTTRTDTYILLNTDTDPAQEATIRVVGVHTVDASWFVL
jgi:Ca2+-binding RTX toxin-like protein